MYWKYNFIHLQIIKKRICTIYLHVQRETVRLRVLRCARIYSILRLSVSLGVLPCSQIVLYVNNRVKIATIFSNFIPVRHLHCSNQRFCSLDFQYNTLNSARLSIFEDLLDEFCFKKIHIFLCFHYSLPSSCVPPCAAYNSH